MLRYLHSVGNETGTSTTGKKSGKRIPPTFAGRQLSKELPLKAVSQGNGTPLSTSVSQVIVKGLRNNWRVFLIEKVLYTKADCTLFANVIGTD